MTITNYLEDTLQTEKSHVYGHGLPNDGGTF